MVRVEGRRATFVDMPDRYTIIHIQEGDEYITSFHIVRRDDIIEVYFPQCDVEKIDGKEDAVVCQLK